MMDELESRAQKLAQELTSFSAELRLAYAYTRDDPGSSLTKSRIVMEKLLLEVYVQEMGREPKKPLLGDMLNDNQFTRTIERRILSRMNAIRDMGNLGPHGEAVEASDAALVLDNLCDILDWYLQRNAKSRPALAVTAEEAVAAPPPAPSPGVVTTGATRGELVLRGPFVVLAVGALLMVLGVVLGWRPWGKPNDTLVGTWRASDSSGGGIWEFSSDESFKIHGPHKRPDASGLSVVTDRTGTWAEKDGVLTLKHWAVLPRKDEQEATDAYRWERSGSRLLLTRIGRGEPEVILDRTN